MSNPLAQEGEAEENVGAHEQREAILLERLTIAEMRLAREQRAFDAESELLSLEINKLKADRARLDEERRQAVETATRAMERSQRLLDGASEALKQMKADRRTIAINVLQGVITGETW
jgi:hypothetical protein